MAAKAGTTPAPTPSPAPPGHNQGPLTRDELDDLFIVHLAQARKDNDALEAAMEAVRAVRKGRTRNRELCRSDGFPLTETDSILKDELLPRHEVEDREAMRLRMRGIANQPGGNRDGGNLLPGFSDSFAQREKDEAYWRGHGLTAGLRGVEQNPEANEVPPEWHQVWMTEWHAGQKRLAKAWETKMRIEGKLPLPATATEGVKLEGAPSMVEATAADDPNARPTSQEDSTATDGAQTAEGELDTSGSATDASTDTAAETSSQDDSSPQSDAGAIVVEPFEASAEELAAQNPRKAIQEANAGDEDPTSEPCAECGAAAGVPCAPDCQNGADESPELA